MNGAQTHLTAALRSVIERRVPRVLAQLERDPDSPSHGHFDGRFDGGSDAGSDRGPPHPDHPDASRQQGLFVLEALRRDTVESTLDPRLVTDWSVAAVNALARQVDRHGGVGGASARVRDDAAAAHALHAVAHVLRGWAEDAPALRDRIDTEPLRRLAHRLSHRLADEATAWSAPALGLGLAALALGLDVPELEVDPARVEGIADRFFSLQHEEGWFETPGGPTPGDLATILDALADLEDATGDPRAAEAAHRVVRFLATLVGADGRLPGLLAPYGIARAAVRDPIAAWLLETVFEDAAAPGHGLATLEDRSLTVDASVVRAMPWLAECCEPTEPARSVDTWLPGAGRRIAWSRDGATSITVDTRRGGIVRIQRRGAPPIVEHGWRLASGRQRWTTNGVCEEREVAEFGDGVRLAGPPITVTHASAHGRRKARSFRRNAPAGPHHERTIRILRMGERLGVEIVDRFDARPGTVVRPAPRPVRGSASGADRFREEDGRPGLLRDEPIELTEKRTITTRWLAPVRCGEEKKSTSDSDRAEIGSPEPEPTL